MSIAVSKSIGKAKINIEVKGCTECGTEFSAGWSIDRLVIVFIGNMRSDVPLLICADCRKKKGNKK